MITITRIRHMYGAPICRYCINEEFQVNLERRNCRYFKHSDVCPRCGKQKHIVKRLTFKGYLKGLRK